MAEYEYENTGFLIAIKSIQAKKRNFKMRLRRLSQVIDKWSIKC